MTKLQLEHEICKLCGSMFVIENEKYNLVKCNQCKLVFARSIYDKTQLEMVYRTLYSQGGGYDQHLGELRSLREGRSVKIGYNKQFILRRMLRQDIKTVVELGAGVGIVANYLQGKVHYIGYEYDTEIADQAQALKFNVKQGDHQLLRMLDKGSVDAIVAFEVLEHVPDIKECLQSIYDCLHPGGLLGFTVPNYDRRLNNKKKLHSNWLGQDTPPVHVNFWNAESMQYTAKLAGFEIVEIKIRKRPYFNWQLPTNTLKQYIAWASGYYFGPTLLGIIKKPVVNTD